MLRAVAAAASVQGCLTVMSTGKGMVSDMPSYRATQDPRSGVIPTNSGELKLAARAEAVVAAMYSGRGLDPAVCTETVVFEDPIACCVGRAEVCEAFRALSAVCSPVSIVRPLAVVVDRGSTDDAGAIELLLNQQYFGGAVRLRSTVVILLASDGRVDRFEERWNGALLVENPAVHHARRLNGLLSYAFTSRFV